MIKKLGLTKMLKLGCIMYMIGSFLMFFAGKNVLFIVICSIVMGIGSLPMAYMSGLMIIDCASYNEWQKRPRMEGTISCVTSFCNNLGQAVGAGFLGILLGIAGYNGALAAQSESAILMIRLLMSVIPAALYILVYMALSFYKLDALKPQMEKNIQAARAEAKAARDENISPVLEKNKAYS
jgi:Na+/melibiose symporter-like transporter